MSAQAAALTRTFKVGSYECTLTFPQAKRGSVVTMQAEWLPAIPERLTTAEITQYRIGRNLALKDLAEIVGGNVAVVE